LINKQVAFQPVDGSSIEWLEASFLRMGRRAEFEATPTLMPSDLGEMKQFACILNFKDDDLNL